jgi:hypothetical protein
MPLTIIEMILTAVFLLSLSALSFEILLVRSFSITQWNHLSFMVISITLFGFAAGGTCLNIIDIRKKTWEKHLSSFENIHIFTILYTLSAIVSFIVLNRIPLDYFRLPLEPIQALYLLTAYLFSPASLCPLLMLLCQKKQVSYILRIWQVQHSEQSFR